MRWPRLAVHCKLAAVAAVSEEKPWENSLLEDFEASYQMKVVGKEEDKVEQVVQN